MYSVHTLSSRNRGVSWPGKDRLASDLELSVVSVIDTWFLLAAAYLKEQRIGMLIVRRISSGRSHGLDSCFPRSSMFLENL